MADTLGALIDIRTQGLENARAARQALEGVGAAAGGSGGGSGASGKMDMLGAAFERFERREPGRVVRQASFALEALAASALGAEGPVGRFAATMTQFGIGGAVGAVAIGGFAAIAGGIKQTIDYAEQLNTAMQNMSATIASLVASAGPLFRLGDLGSGEGPESAKFDVPQPGLLGRWMSRVQGFMRTTVSDITSGRGIQEGDAEQAFDITNMFAATAMANATRIASRQITAERNRRIKVDQDRRAAEAERARKEMDAQAIRDAEFTFGFTGRQIRVSSPFGRTGLEGPALRSLDLGFGERPREVGAFERDLGFNLTDTLRPHPAAPFVDETFAKERSIDWRRLAAAGVGFAGTVAGFGQAGPLQKFGSLLGAGAGVAEAIPGGQLPGAVLAGLSGLFSLFGGAGKKPGVTIEAYSAQALEQMKTVRSDPATTQYIVVPAGDPRAVAYDQGRLASRGVIARTP